MTLTPIERHDGILVKRDDTFDLHGQRGGKVRTCLALGKQALRAGSPGLITAGSRHSPQVAIVATVGDALGLPVRVHVPAGAETPEILWATALGAEVVRHRPGYNSVIVARAREDAAESGWFEVPFGMECREAVTQTSTQVANVLAAQPRRVVVPVGSGMSLAGILTGFDRASAEAADLASLPPVLGVQVGADPTARLDVYGPPWWRVMATVVKSSLTYAQRPAETHLGELDLDPVYEAKCLPFLEPGDLLWVVGRRG